MSWLGDAAVTVTDSTMEKSTGSVTPFSTSWKRLARRLLTIGENRIELLTVEMEEGRDRLLRAFLMALGVAAFGMLATFTLTAAIVVWLWAYSRLAVLLTLTGLYAAAGVYLGLKLKELLRTWHTLPASLDQLRKDRACLEKVLE
jgi:uncharacterized membrane protein YqjE